MHTSIGGAAKRIVFDAEDVRDRLSKLLADDDLRRYIL
jgi:ATP-dependent protease HslVU (ClpYQ) ATPase subunit